MMYITRLQWVFPATFRVARLILNMVAIHVQVKNRGWNIIQGIFLLNEK